MRGIVKVLVIGVLGLAGLLVPVGYVYPADNTYESCRDQGFDLCKDGTCSTRKCYCEGKLVKPAEQCSNTLAGKVYVYSCNGCSGKLDPMQISTPQPTLPQLTPAVPPRRQVRPPAGGTLQKSP